MMQTQHFHKNVVLYKKGKSKMLMEHIHNCTGCGACFNICPKNAITMQNDEYGFYKPIIDKVKCIHCGLCEKICPLDNYKSNNISEPKVFAFQNNDEETLYKCASGGAFASFAKYIIEQGGIVYGVIYDENLVVCHSRTDNLTDLEKMYSSKYVQSNTKDTFRQAKTDLENGKTVLYSGTPCQIGGLKSYLQKDYENLITVDLVCHGVPSPLVFEKYKQEGTAKLPEAEKLLNINFRSKVKGWDPILNTTTTTTNAVTTVSMLKDDFMRAFLSNLCINTSCLNCQFNKLPRIADISVADFWGVENYDESLNDGKGLSIVIVNNGKGQEVIINIPSECLLKEVPLEVVVKYNRNICNSSVAHKNREKFLKDISHGKKLNKCVKKYHVKPLYKRLFNYLPQFLKDFIIYKILKKEM